MTVLDTAGTPYVHLLRRPTPWVVGVVAAVIVAIFGPHDAATVAVALTAWGTGVLAVIDFHTHRLPNLLVLPLAAGVLVTLFITAAASDRWTALLAAFVGGVGLGLVYFVLALIKAGGMGGGDIKLALVLGMTGGWYGLHAWMWVFFAPFVVGGLLALVGLSVRRVTWTAHMPFGPALAIGYIIAAVFAF
jgi:leader peptidase (prepilin peptidase)/N-methyltransferase